MQSKNQYKLSVLVSTLLVGLSLTGCGGGGGVDGATSTTSNTTSTSSITIVDPYVSGATAFWDKNNNGVLDNGEPESTASDSSGKATFNVAIPEGARIIMNTKGTHNGEAYKGTLTANYSSTGVLSPLTTLEEKGYSKTEIVSLLAAAGITLTEADINANPMAGLSSSTTTATDADLAKIQAAVAINTFLEMKNMFDVTKTKTNIAAVTTDLTTIATLMKETITTTNIASSNADVMIKAAVAIGNYVVSNPTNLATVNTNKATIITNLKTNITSNPTLQVKLSDATGTIDLRPTTTSGFTQTVLKGKTLWTISPDYGVVPFIFNSEGTTLTYGSPLNITVDYAITSDGIIDTIENNGNTGHEYYKLLSVDGSKYSLCDGEVLNDVKSCTTTTQLLFTNQADAEKYIIDTVKTTKKFTEEYLKLLGNHYVVYRDWDDTNDVPVEFVGITNKLAGGEAYETDGFVDLNSTLPKISKTYAISDGKVVQTDSGSTWTSIIVDSTNDYIVGCDLDSGETVCEEQAKFYIFKDKTKAQTKLDELNSQIISVADGFGADWINGKTLWSVDTDKNKATLMFKDGINYGQPDLLDNIPLSPIFTGDYTITQNGIIKVDETSLNAGQYQYYKLLTINADETQFTICAGQNENDVTECTITKPLGYSNYAYFFTTKAATQAKLDELNAQSISVENGFNTEWLNGRTLYTVDGGIYHFICNGGYFTIFNNTGQILTDKNGKEYNLPYTITSEGIIKVDESDIQWDDEDAKRPTGTYEYYKILAIDGGKISLAEGQSFDTVKNSTTVGQYFFTTEEAAQNYLISLQY